MISEETIHRSHRVGKFDMYKTNPRLVIVKFSHYNVLHNVFANKRKLKGKEISISENLTKLRLVKLNEARDQNSLGNIWSFDRKVMFKDSNNKVKVSYD